MTTLAGRPIASIAVVGQGIAAWVAAATLARRLPGVAVSVTPAPGLRPALGDRFAIMLPSARAFHAAIGLDEARLFAATTGVFRLGVKLEGWSGAQPGFVAAYGRYGPERAPAPVHQLWLRDGAEPFAALAPGAVLAAAGRFALPTSDLDHGWATACSADGYRAYLADHARRLRVRETAPLAEVATADDRITTLRLRDGAAVVADLYVDASGPDACLLSRLPGGDTVEDWREWLPIDTAVVADSPADPMLPPVDTARAEANGWSLVSPLRDRTVRARLFECAALSAEDVVRELGGAAAATFEIRAGRRRAAWIGNCVAIGDAAVQLEPLRAPHLHLVHQACDRITALLPDTAFAAVEMANYNREWAEAADRMRDFVLLHYATATRPEPFWRRVRAARLPAELAQALGLFAERGRLPARDRDSFGEDQWLAVLLGHGVRPRRLDALIDGVPRDAAAALLRAHQLTVGAAAARALSHADALSIATSQERETSQGCTA